MNGSGSRRYAKPRDVVCKRATVRRDNDNETRECINLQKTIKPENMITQIENSVGMVDFSAIKKMYNISKPDGFSDDEMRSIQSIFGNLPKVFVDYYSELGKIERLNRTQDRLITPDEFQYFKNDDYLIFYCENQKVCVWAIHKNDLAKPNPPVYMSEDEKEWKLEADTLSDFFTAMAYLQAVFALDYGAETFYEIEENDLTYIRNHYANKGVSFKQWTTGIEFYGNYDDSIVSVMGNGQHLLYSSDNKAHFDEMNADLSKIRVAMKYDKNDNKD